MHYGMYVCVDDLSVINTSNFQNISRNINFNELLPNKTNGNYNSEYN